MRALKTSCSLCVVSLAFLFTNACQNQSNVSNINSAGGGNATINMSVTPATTTTVAVADASSGIETREPEKYAATLVVTAQTTGGDRVAAIPQLDAEVARNGTDRRFAFKLPNNEQLIYLDRADTRYVISPDRKQYAELTREATGFDVQRLMTPGQIVGQLQKMRGYTLAGEEQVGGRTALKYTYAGTSHTGTQAGDVKAEAFVYVDKETGLPLRAEINSEAEGNVQGIKGIKIVSEMRDIKSDVDPKMFEIPEGYSKVAPEQVRQQINALVAIAQAILQSVIGQSSPPSAQSNNNAASMTPTMTPVP